MVKGAFRLLHPRVQEALERLGYEKPTPIQEKAIPVLLAGRDAVLVAPTGSGKTEAALLPILSRILEADVHEKGVKILYVTPLRSLNRDLFLRMVKLVDLIGLRMFVRHGDSTPSERRIFLQEGYDVVVMTPETLEYLLSSSDKFRRMLRPLRAVIIDELHELIDDKRGAELSVVLERIDALLSRRVQRVGLSATIGDPSLAAQFIAGAARLPAVVVEDPTPKKLEVSVELGEEGVEAEYLSARLGVERDTAARLVRIASLLEKYRSILVFTNTRDTAELLGKLLKVYIGEDKVLVHHGSLSREERLEAERLFREAKVPLLVATSSLELGIDIGHVEYVVQYLSPRQASKLAQRVGRSGHTLGKVSRGEILASRNFYDILESIVLATRAKRGDIEEPRPHVNPLDVLVHEIAGIVDEYGEISVDKLYSIIASSFVFQGLDCSVFKKALELARSARIVRLDGDIVKRGGRLRRYHYSVTMIPDVKHYVVIEYGSGRKVGVLDEVFAADLEPGKRFVLAGRLWEVLEVRDERIIVKRVDEGELILPSWEGDLIPVEYNAAREAGALIRRLASGDKRVLREYVGSREAWSRVIEVVNSQVGKGYPIPSDRTIVVESYRDVVIILGFFGTRVAKTLELLTAKLIGEMLGYTPRSASNAYAIVLKLARQPARELLETLAGMLKKLECSEVEKLVREAAVRTSLYMWKLYHVAVRMGLIEKDAKPERRFLESLVDTLAGREALNELIHDKLDFGNTCKLLQLIKNGSVKIEVVYGREPSPMALEALRVASSGDKVREEAIPASVLAEVVKRRLESKSVALVCLRCGWSVEREISLIDDKPRCERCGSGLLAVVKPGDVGEVKRLVEGSRSGRLRGEERRKWRELLENANLVLTYGKLAIYALAARGVGVQTAKRVLAKAVYGEEAFFKALVEAELRYMRTRRYWR